jgi:hypothetical protein
VDLILVKEQLMYWKHLNIIMRMYSRHVFVI